MVNKRGISKGIKNIYYPWDTPNFCMPPNNCNYKAKTSQSQNWTWAHYTYWTFSPGFSWTLENFQLGHRSANVIRLFRTDFLLCQINSENHLKVSWANSVEWWRKRGETKKQWERTQEVVPTRIAVAWACIEGSLCLISVSVASSGLCVLWTLLIADWALSLGWMRSLPEHRVGVKSLPEGRSMLYKHFALMQNDNAMHLGTKAQLYGTVLPAFPTRNGKQSTL